MICFILVPQPQSLPGLSVLRLNISGLYRLLVTSAMKIMFSYAKMLLDGPDHILSETRVYDLVSDKVRSGPLGSPTSSRTLSGHSHF